MRTVLQINLACLAGHAAESANRKRQREEDEKAPGVASTGGGAPRALKSIVYVDAHGIWLAGAGLTHMDMCLASVRGQCDDARYTTLKPWAAEVRTRPVPGVVSCPSAELAPLAAATQPTLEMPAEGASAHPRPPHPKAHQPCGASRAARRGAARRSLLHDGHREDDRRARTRPAPQASHRRRVDPAVRGRRHARTGAPMRTAALTNGHLLRAPRRTAAAIAHARCLVQVQDLDYAASVQGAHAVMLRVAEALGMADDMPDIARKDDGSVSMLPNYPSSSSAALRCSA